MTVSTPHPPSAEYPASVSKVTSSLQTIPQEISAVEVPVTPLIERPKPIINLVKVSNRKAIIDVKVKIFILIVAGDYS